MPEWVSEGSARKYVRAVAQLKKDGNKEPTEEQIKALYVKYGGLVLEPLDGGSDEEDEAPKPRTRRTKKDDE